MNTLLVLVCVLVAGSQVDAASFFKKGKNCLLKNLLGVRLDVDKLLTRMDANQDGLVSIKEDTANLLSMGTNNDSYTSRDEFVNFMGNFLCYPANLASLAFDHLDQTKDNRLTGADIHTANFDANGNAKVASLKKVLLGLDTAVQAEQRKLEVTMEMIKNKFEKNHGVIIG